MTKFTKKAKETLDFEALLHHCNSVTELGWEPAPGSYPTNLSKDKKLRGHYLLTVNKPDGTVLKIFPQLMNGWKLIPRRKFWQQLKELISMS